MRTAEAYEPERRPGWGQSTPRCPRWMATPLPVNAPAITVSAGAHLDIPCAIKPLSAGVLLSRGTATKFTGEWQPIGKTVHVNSDTSFRDWVSRGVLGVHYWELANGIVELRRLARFDKPPALRFGRVPSQRNRDTTIGSIQVRRST